LKKGNDTESKLKAELRDSMDANKTLFSQATTTKGEIITLERAVEECNRTIRHLEEDPINVENKEVKERLRLLSALEAGGVDNWEWYDESISNYNKDYIHHG